MSSNVVREMASAPVVMSVEIENGMIAMHITMRRITSEGRVIIYQGFVPDEMTNVST